MPAPGRRPFFTRPGIEARDAEPVQAIVNLALLTGQIGKEGAGIFALTEHNNLQGVCDMGMLPDRLPGYREVASDAARAEVEKIWRNEAAGEAGAGLALALRGSRSRPGASGLALPLRPGQHGVLWRRGQRARSSASWSWRSICS